MYAGKMFLISYDQSADAYRWLFHNGVTYKYENETINSYEIFNLIKYNDRNFGLPDKTPNIQRL